MFSWVFSYYKCNPLPNNEEHNGKFMARSERSTDFRYGGKRFLFKFFHKIDLERVQNGSPWTFNNHLLVLHRMVARENPLQVPLLLVCFWLQVHELPPSFFSEQLARQLGDFVGAFMEYDTKSLGRGFIRYMRTRVLIDVRQPLKRKKKLMFASSICTYVNFKNEELTLFYFYCWCLGHSDSFSQIKMESETNVAHMGWDLSIQVQSKRALTMNSFWLKGRGNTNGGIMAESINPISRINLEEELRGAFGQVDIEHDSKEQYWEAEGKKATWGR